MEYVFIARIYLVPDWEYKASVLTELSFLGLRDKDRQEKQCTQINITAGD